MTSSTKRLGALFVFGAATLLTAKPLEAADTLTFSDPKGDDNDAGNSDSPDHPRSPWGGSHIKGQKIPSSRLTRVIGTLQHLPGIHAVFQHLQHLYWIAMRPSLPAPTANRMPAEEESAFQSESEEWPRRAPSRRETIHFREK